MIRSVLCLLAVLALGAAAPNQRDPDWPCEQIRTPELSLAAIWSGPAVDPRQYADWRQDSELVRLVQETSQRRLPLSEAQARIVAFARQSGEQKQARLLHLLVGLFDVLDAERRAVIDGLDRFGVRQKELAAVLRDDNEKLRALQADAKSDQGEVNQLIQRVTWEAEVFQDRREALRYACDVPSKIDQRLFALARTIQATLQ